MIDLYRKIFILFDATERRHFWLLTIIMVLVAMAEIVGMSSIFLLLNVLADPAAIEKSGLLSYLYGAFDFGDPFHFQVALSVVVMFVVLGGLGLKALGAYASILFSTMRGFSISSRLLASYLSQPYSWFLERNSAEIGKTVLSEVDGLVGRVISPALRLIANALQVVAVLGFLLFVDPLVTLFCGAFLGAGYALIYLKLRGRLHRFGVDMASAFERRFRVAQEATGGIKDVKVLGLEDRYVERYAAAARKAARASAMIGVMGEVPRFVLEALTIGTLLSLILVLLLQNGGSISEIVPLLGVIAFSTMRLLAALQQIYHGLTMIRGASATLDQIVTDFTSAPAPIPVPKEPRAALRLDRSLEISNVSFRYVTASGTAIHDLDLTILAGMTIGVVGGTGAGKTTLVDLILGLLVPTGGEIRVDGTTLVRENLRGWQKSLGYVPQSIYLTDDTIAANIAFGIPEDEMDMAAVERAARTAALHDFVTTELAEGYQTLVGERGVRLSGGQRQRIGIARALYRDPSLLIMDEATSALDNITERVVMEAVQRVRSEKTVILIAHRLSTVKDCDVIFLMDHGKLVAKGTYDSLLAENETFRRMVVGEARQTRHGGGEGATSPDDRGIAAGV